MAITSPALAMSVEAMFGNIRPALDKIQKLGSTDFSKDAPGIDIKPGTTVKVPISAVTAASAYNASNNNYLTGGTTSWQSLTATHYLQGFDLCGTDIDSGVNAPRVKQLFSKRAGLCIAMAIMAAAKTALDSCTASTGLTLAATSANSGAGVPVADYIALGGSITWLNKETSVLAVNGACLADIKAKLAAINVVPASMDELGQYLGFQTVVLIPGMTARACIVPAGAMGFISRVPALIAKYSEAGIETDDESGLAVGIVVANDQATNKIVVNGDLWFGAATLSANAGNTTAGIIKLS